MPSSPPGAARQSAAPDLAQVLAHAEQFIAAGQIDAAIALYRQWLATADSPLAYVARFNLAVALGNAGRPAEAEAAYRDAVARHPHFLPSYLNLGTLLEAQGRPEEALATWRAILGLPPQVLAASQGLHIQALNNLARLLEIQRRFPDAESLLEQSLRLDPKQPHALQHWIHLRQKQCKWPVFAPLPGITQDEMRASVSALAGLSAHEDPAMTLDVARRFVAEKVQALPPLAPPHGYAHARLRIGYLSSDFCLHPVSLLMAEVFELHDRSRVEVFGFCWSREDGSALRQRVVGAFDHYVRIAGMSDEEAAQCIRGHEIDILVDLHGLTSGVRPNILARKPAPVQVTYLGYPGTTGMPAIDYVVADRFVLPEALAPFFSERPLYLPDCFQASDRQRPVAPTPTRASCGLPDGAFVFCSFNNNYKFTPALFDVWTNILRAVPNSVLWLLADNEWAEANLIAEAGRRGIARDRLVFAARVAPEVYLARYRLADLFLDTTPFNAGTTANDALWMGLPLLTCAGRTFSSRMAGSLLTALGLPELITTDLTQYEATAIRFAQQPEELAALRERLAHARVHGPVFDMPRFVRHLEAAFASVAVRPAQPQPAAAEDPRGYIEAARARFPGPTWLEWLAWLLQERKPRIYAAIGQDSARTLGLVQAGTRAVAVDPEPAITDGLPGWSRVFKAATEAFFATQTLADVTDGEAIDLALLGGDHAFEPVVRSVLRLERHARPNSVIAIRDTLPLSAATASPERQSPFWLGDTWKAVQVLRELRPDLHIMTIPAFPGGLTLIARLDPHAEVAADRLDDSIARWRDTEFTGNAKARLETTLGLVPNDFAYVAALLNHQQAAG